MALQPVAGWRCGDSLPAELRSGVKEWQGTNLMPSLRLSAGQSGLAGMSIFRGATEGPSGFRAYNWPPYGYRGINGLGMNVDAYPASPWWDRNAGWTGLAGLGQDCVSYDVEGNCLAYDTGSTTDTGYTYDTSQYNVYQTPYCAANPNDPGCVASNATGVNYANMQTTPVNVGGTTVQAQSPAGYGGAKVVLAGQTPPQAPAGYQWIPVINSAGQNLAQVLAVAQGGGYTVGPRGTTVAGSPGVPTSAAQAPTFSAGLFTNPTSMVLILGAGLLLVMMMQSSSRR